MKKRLIVVLGMHRSGTSAITRGLQVIGVNLGDNLLAPFKGENDKGFWEDFDIVSLNDEMLNTINQEWHSLSLIKTNDFEALIQKGYRYRAIELIQQKTHNTSIFGFKDPRTIKLLPFWKEVFTQCQFDVNYVLIVRSPLSVANSLAKRNGFDVEKSYLMWLYHVVNSLSGTMDCTRIVVDYDNLIRNPESELRRIAITLHLECNSAELEIYKSKFLDNTLRHYIYKLNDVKHDEAASAIVREVCKTVSDLSCSRQIDDKLLQRKIYKWQNELELLEPALSLADKLFNQKVALEQSVNEHNKTIIKLNELLINQEQQILQKNEEIVKGKETLNKVYSSKSWRVTNPFRVIMRFLQKKLKMGGGHDIKL